MQGLVGPGPCGLLAMTNMRDLRISLVNKVNRRERSEYIMNILEEREDTLMDLRAILVFSYSYFFSVDENNSNKIIRIIL